MEERAFKGIWIPREVWLDTRLSALDKSVLAEVDSLDNGEDGCYASNEYLAKFCQCSEWKISTSITKLIELGYLKRVSFDGRTRKLKSSLGFSQIQTLENHKADLGKPQAINIDKSIEEKIENNIRASDDGFDEFYALYPKKKAKKDALKAWKALNPNLELRQTIRQDIEARLRGDWGKRDRFQYIPFPATYLRGQRWEDESEMRTDAKPTRPADEDLFAGLTEEQIAEYERLANDGYHFG